MQKLLISILFLTITLFICNKTYSQISELDFHVIEEQGFIVESFQVHPPHYLFESKSFFLKYNPLSLTFGGLMFFYQKFVSPQFSASCLYDPSCSNFSKKLINEYGIIKGVFLSADRLTRCNKLAAQEIHSLKLNSNTGKVIESVEIYRIKKK